MPFSSDTHDPPIHHGRDAGLKQARAAAKPRGTPGRKPSGGGGAAQHDPGHRVGLPQAPPQAEPEADYRHLLALTQHRNMQGLGREAPVGSWMINTGQHLGLFKPGQWPADILLQGALRDGEQDL